MSITTELHDGTRLEFPDGTDPAVIQRTVRNLLSQRKPQEKAPDPTEGMSGMDRFRAGMGKAMVDTARGLGQMVGLVDRSDVEESRRLDAPLMSTTGGKVGNFAGNVATTVPLAFIPGANTVRGATLIGAATGLAQPSASTSETIQNAALGGALGGGSILAGRGLAAAYQAGTGLLRPMTKGGQRQIAAEVLQSAATDPGAASRNLASVRELVPGSAPTVGQAAQDPGLAQLERTLLNNPETAGPLQRRYAEQMAARQKAIADVAGTPGYRDLIDEGRRIFANQDYAEAAAQGFDPAMSKALKPQIDNLMQRPSIQQAKAVAKRLAAENGIKLDKFGSVEGMDWLKKALDNQISAAKKPGSSIGDAEVRALVQTKDDLMKTLEQIAPAYKTANDNFAAMSKQINATDVAGDLQRRLYKDAQWGGGKETGATYRNALAQAVESVKPQTGMDMALSDIMPTRDIAALEGVAKDLVRKESGQNLGRAVGSPTMQNMLGQNYLQRIAGPLGLPQGIGQNALMQTLSRPYGWAARAGEAPINALLAEALADPATANALLRLAIEPSRVGAVAHRAERFLPVLPLAASESGP